MPARLVETWGGMGKHGEAWLHQHELERDSKKQAISFALTQGMAC